MSLSDDIAEDLKIRISTGEHLPESLSIVDLSIAYGVSSTPIREAIRRLTDEGYIEKLPNRRLRITPGMIGTGSAGNPVEQPAKPADWGEILLEEVMHESLRRQAIYLREELLAEKLGVGRSIIRQTFSTFAGAGLLEHVPRRGWMVHPFRQQDMEAYLVVREALELKALELARARIDKREVQAILDSEMHALNNALHRYIIRRSENRYIADFFSRYVSRYYTRLFYYAAPETEVVDEMTGQHREILESLLDEEWQRAARVLSAHIRAQKTVLEKLLVGGNGRLQ